MRQNRNILINSSIIQNTQLSTFFIIVTVCFLNPNFPVRQIVWGWLFILLSSLCCRDNVFIYPETSDEGCLSLGHARMRSLLLSWFLPRLLTILRRQIEVISIMGQLLDCWFCVTTDHCGLEGGDVCDVCEYIAMLIQVTAHPIPSPQQISISKWLNQLQYIIISMFSRTIVYIYFANMSKLMSRLRRNKIIFSADILFVFCEWVTYSGPCSLPSGAAHFIFHSLTFEITIENLCCIVKLKT